MLTRFEVKGFKTLVDVSVDLGAVNVFIGANGSGKSNLLEAVGFLSAVGASGPEPEAFRYRGLRDADPMSCLSTLRGAHGSKLTLSAISDDTEYYAELSPSTSDPSEWAIDKEIIKFYGKVCTQREGSIAHFSQEREPIDIEVTLKPDRSAKFFTMGLIKPAVKIFTNLEYAKYTRRELLKMNPTVTIDLLDDYAIYTPSTAQLRGLPGDIHRTPLGLSGSGLGRAVKEMMAIDSAMLGPFDMDDVLDLIEWADQVGTNANKDSLSLEGPIRLQLGDRFVEGDRKMVSAIDASEGSLYVLFLLTLVGHERSPNIFAVDNFDQALHPRLARELTSLICNQILEDGTRQMLATTHNPLVLNGLNLLDDRIRLFTVDRDETGATQIERVMVTEELMAKSEAGFSLSQLWTTGRLGGVPQNY